MLTDLFQEMKFDVLYVFKPSVVKWNLHCLSENISPPEYMWAGQTEAVICSNSPSTGPLFSTVIERCLCMPLPWAPHQGPDKRGTHNNLLLEAPRWAADQTLPRVHLLSHNMHIISASAPLLIPKQLDVWRALVCPSSWSHSAVQNIQAVFFSNGCNVGLKCWYSCSNIGKLMQSSRAQEQSR